jgi:hypothetical protein
MAISRFKTSTLAQGLPKYQDVWDGVSAVLQGAFESISTATVGAGGSSAITFSSIPSTYTHLQLRCYHTNSNTSQGANLRINNDASGIYARHYIGGYGVATAQVGGAGDLTNISMYYFVGNPNSTTPQVEIIDFLDYKNTSKTKTVRALVGSGNSASGEMNLVTGLWNSTAAINRVDVLPTAGTFNQNSVFALYGIKGA